MDYPTYYDKVLDCWLGKSIGGFLGATVEGIKETNNFKFYQDSVRIPLKGATI